MLDVQFLLKGKSLILKILFTFREKELEHKGVELRESEAGGRKSAPMEVENPGGTAGVGSEMMSLAWELGFEVPHMEVLEGS